MDIDAIKRDLDAALQNAGPHVGIAFSPKLF
jgi:hypothetical protein